MLNQQSAKNLANLIKGLKKYGSAPILQGFGIAQPQQIKDALKSGVAGAISGSAISANWLNKISQFKKMPPNWQNSCRK